MVQNIFKYINQSVIPISQCLVIMYFFRPLLIDFFGIHVCFMYSILCLPLNSLRPVYFTGALDLYIRLIQSLRTSVFIQNVLDNSPKAVWFMQDVVKPRGTAEIFDFLRRIMPEREWNGHRIYLVLRPYLYFLWIPMTYSFGDTWCWKL